MLLAGCSILITSYTNSAVDNILIKLLQEQRKRSQGKGTQPQDADVDLTFLRIGSANAVHPDIRPYMAGGEM